MIFLDYSLTEQFETVRIIQITDKMMLEVLFYDVLC